MTTKTTTGRIFGEVTTCRHCEQPIHLAFCNLEGDQVWAHEVAKGCHSGCLVAGECVGTVATP